MIFYIIIGILVLSACGLIFSKQILHSALFLLVMLLVVTVVFILARAEFMAVTQLIVYIGGILILILFGIIVTQEKTKPKSNKMANIPAFLVVGAFGYLLFQIISNYNFNKEAIIPAESEFNLTEQIGIALITENVIAFEFAALFLLISLIGALVIAGRN